jgi:hypothetical protein
MGIEQRLVDETPQRDRVETELPPSPSPSNGTGELPRRVRPSDVVRPDPAPAPPDPWVAQPSNAASWAIDDSTAFAAGLRQLDGRPRSDSSAPPVSVTIQFDDAVSGADHPGPDPFSGFGPGDEHDEHGHVGVDTTPPPSVPAPTPAPAADESVPARLPPPPAATDTPATAIADTAEPPAVLPADAPDGEAPPAAARADRELTLDDLLAPISIAGPALALAPFAHLDASEDPPAPNILVDASDTTELPLRPSLHASPRREPTERPPLTPLFGGGRESVTDATTGFGFRPPPEEDAPVGRRVSTLWPSRPLLDVAGPDADGASDRWPLRTKLVLAGLAVTALPIVGVATLWRGPSSQVASAGSQATPEVASVTYTIDRPTTVPTIDVSNTVPGGPPVDGVTTIVAPGEPGALPAALPAPPPPPPPPPPSSVPGVRTTVTTIPARPEHPTTTAVVKEAFEPDGLGGASAEEVQALDRIRQNRSWIADSNGCYGAYQFSQEVWDRLAGTHRPGLVGTRPSKASKADQNTLALAFLREPRDAPWNACAVAATS